MAPRSFASANTSFLPSIRVLLGSCILLCCLWALFVLPSFPTRYDDLLSFPTSAVDAAHSFNPSSLLDRSHPSTPAPDAEPPTPPPPPSLSTALSSYVFHHYPSTLSSTGFSAQGRYLIFFVGDDGLGNKVLPLVSAFFLSFLLDRTFVVHWTGSEAVHNTPMFIEELYRPPEGMTWNFEGLARATLTTALRSRASPALTELLARFQERRRVKLPDARVLFTALQLPFAEVDMRTADYGLVKERALCDDWREEYRDVPVLLMQGDQYFIPPLQANLHYRPVVAPLVNDSDVFGPLARFLLRPSTDVQEYIEPFMRRHFTPFTVGLQLRRRERLGLRDSEVELALRCARSIVSEWRAAGHETERVAFYVASDDNGMRSSVRERLKDVGEVWFTDEFMVREDMNRGLFYAVVDTQLLARTQAIVVTPSSTFGYLSHAYGSLVPWRASLQPATECQRAASAEPSAHFWQPLMREAVRQCIDKTRFPSLMAQEECCPRWH